MSRDQIIIENLQLPARIGVYQQEKQAPQTILLNLLCDCDFKPALQSGDLAQTIDYDQVILAVKNILAKQHYALLESLAETIASDLFKQFPLLALDLTIYKPEVHVGLANVGVRIHRVREDYV